jgi:hypothetical protein
MLFDQKSVVTGILFRPAFRRVLPSAVTFRNLPNRPSVHHPTIPFRATTNIQRTAGGFYGDEFRPD